MANTTINGIVLQDMTNAFITENAEQKTSNLTVIPLYLADSQDTEVFDFGGVTKTISLSGFYIHDTPANLKTWIDSVDALQQGHQDVDAGAPYTFVDDLRGTLKVKVMDFTSSQAPGEPTRISWTLKLVESSTNA